MGIYTMALGSFDKRITVQSWTLHHENQKPSVKVRQIDQAGKGIY